MWHADDVDAEWRVLVYTRQGSQRPAEATLSYRRIDVAPLRAHRVYRAHLTVPRGRREFDYAVHRRGAQVFASHAIVPASDPKQQRIVVTGDVGHNLRSARKIAHAIDQVDPDLIVIPGDVVYMDGRISEYRRNFFPVYNAHKADRRSGAPLLRSRVVLPGLGFHDSTADLKTYPDCLAFFMYWAAPLNGPQLLPGDPNTPILIGDPTRQQLFLDAADSRFPTMAHYSVRLGDTHWVVLDSNEYVDWSSHNNKKLRQWLTQDLDSARDATWRFVSCYLPPFNSANDNGVTHWTQTKKMRAIVDILEQGAVDIVFSGMVHNYQRTFPLRFRPYPDAFPLQRAKQYNTSIDGYFELDTEYEGARDTRPRGIIYVVTGAGGNLLHRGQGRKPETWQPYTAKFVSDLHSFTLLDIQSTKLLVRQISGSGVELDHFVVNKA
jgi:acid phosphatase type 7